MRVLRTGLARLSPVESSRQAIWRYAHLHNRKPFPESSAHLFATGLSQTAPGLPIAHKDAYLGHFVRPARAVGFVAGSRSKQAWPLLQLENPQDGGLRCLRLRSHGPFPYRLPSMGFRWPHQLESKDSPDSRQQSGGTCPVTLLKNLALRVACSLSLPPGCAYPKYCLSGLDGRYRWRTNLASSPCHRPCGLHACHESQLDHVSIGPGLRPKVPP